MNIGTVPSNIFPNIYAITAYQGDRMSVPVSPSSYIYSHFKHVSGVPASEGESGVNINKLKIIDTLIEQLSRMKREREPLVTISGKDDEKHINALIEQYHSQVRTIQAGNTNNPYASAAPLTGTLFSLSV